MRYYTIQNNSLLRADTRQALERFYDNVSELPEDYEEGKYIVVDGELVLNPDWEEEQKQKERGRLAKLSMTKREMFLGLYQAKGITPDMLKAQISDPQALIEFEYANDYYRGNPLIDLIGTQLGFTTEQLDRFFETKDYKELLPAEEETEDNGTGQASDTSSNSPVIYNEVTDEDTTAE